jgi:hypothetical protein
MDELFASDIKLVYPQSQHFIFENGDDTYLSKVLNNRVDCPSFKMCVNWAKHQKNVSVLLLDKVAEDNFARGFYVGENSEPLLCSLEDGVVFTSGHSMIMFYGDPLLRRVTEIIDRVVEAGIYNFWVSLSIH